MGVWIDGAGGWAGGGVDAAVARGAGVGTDAGIAGGAEGFAAGARVLVVVTARGAGLDLTAAWVGGVTGDPRCLAPGLSEAAPPVARRRINGAISSRRTVSSFAAASVDPWNGSPGEPVVRQSA
ncbi:MAG TPA: hypothetical protein VGJ25_03210 [Gaiellaceae bacterium]